MSAWVVKIEEELRSLVPETIQRRRIYRLPTTDAYSDREARDAYRPYKVSVGPWHAEEVEKKKKDWPLGKGEELKRDCLVHFLRRSGKPAECYYMALGEVVDELRDAYDGLERRWRDRDNTGAFLEMMLLDGCFLLEFIYTLRDVKSRPEDDCTLNLEIMRVLENREEMKCYVHDVLLLENQVPLKLLETLHVVSGWGTAVCAQPHSLQNTAYPKQIACKASWKVRCTYWTRVYRRTLVHRDFERENASRRKDLQVEFNSTIIPAAKELNKLGMEFTISDSSSPLDISFHHNTLKLAVLVVDGSTKSTFLNLIAFEQLQKNVDTRMEVSSYMYFMGCLIQGGDDARLLQMRGIIDTTLRPYEVFKLFRRMSKHISLNGPLDPEYVEMLTMVRARFDKLSNVWRKDLFQTYLKSPWAVMSVMAAILLFTLSIIQTVYTVLCYVRPK